MSMDIIGITGYSGSGKTTVARFIQAIAAEEDWEVLAFADPLKIEAKNQYGWDGKKDEKGRKLLLSIGKTHREQDKLYLIKLMTTLITYCVTVGREKFIIHDVRFKEEADFIKGIGGVLVKIYRDSINKINDESETQLNDYKFDYIIHNKGTLCHLLQKTKKFYDWYIKNRKKIKRTTDDEEAISTYIA